ncbi:MAG: leucine-rich repeat domain-containing protein [Hormoscilla sp. GUM202]|nr:leucine-rich repeat domain-containing protein [Hormoscilla sp. GUM202]
MAIEAAKQRIEQVRRDGGIALDLNKLDLTEVPEAIGQLANLQKLELKENQITNLPEAIGQLVNLRVLNVRGNQITSLPEAIGRLVKLQVLDISENQITNLPEAMVELVNLQLLYLQENPLNGELAAAYEHGTASLLQYMRSKSKSHVLGEIVNRFDIESSPFVKDLGRSPEEQLQKNQAAIAIIRGWLEEEVTEEEAKEREIYFEYFKEIVDSTRLPGHKIYS